MSPASVAGGECHLVTAPTYAVLGRTGYDQNWIDDTTERVVAGCHQPRPQARPASLDAAPKAIAKAKPKPAPTRKVAAVRPAPTEPSGPVMPPIEPEPAPDIPATVADPHPDTPPPAELRTRQTRWWHWKWWLE